MSGRLAQYELIHHLGEGGMGVVWKARDTRLGRLVALKVLRSGDGALERRHRFLREAQAASALTHPNIVAIYEFGTDGDVDFIAMELVEGQPLSAMLNNGAMPVGKALKLAAQTASALEAAHARGIVHRDLKPANIMVTRSGSVKVTDFGLAKLERAAEADGKADTAILTAEGLIAGTAAYMSPEQAEGDAVDSRSDIFSFGAVLYEIVTGRRAFQGASRMSVLAAVLRADPPSPSSIAADVPREVERLIRRCLQKDPAARYQHAADLAATLEDLKSDFELGLLRSAAKPGWRPRWSAGVALGLTAACVLAAALAWRTPKPPELSRAKFTALTTETGQEYSPAFSPDGSSYAYSGEHEGRTDVFVRRIGGRNAANLTRQLGRVNAWPAYSPDGSTISFYSNLDGGGIYLMGATGENPRRLTRRGVVSSWSADGKEIAFSTSGYLHPQPRAELRSELWVARVSDGTLRRIEAPDAVQPAWSPHGHRIAYWGVRGNGPARDVWTVGAAGGQASVAVTSDDDVDWSPQWSADGRYLFFSSMRGGVMNLWRVRINEQTGEVLSAPEPETLPGPNCSMLSFSRDGMRFLFRSGVYQENVAAVGFDPVRKQLVPPVRALTSGENWFRNPSVSPDGRTIAMHSVDAQADLWLMDSSGANLRKLTDSADSDRFPRWLADGRTIVFYSNRDGSHQLWKMQADGTGLTQLTKLGGPPIWFPIPSWANSLVAFHQLATSNYLLDLSQQQEAPKPFPIFQEGDVFFRGWSWSPDGKLLAMSGQRGTFWCCGIGLWEHDTGKFRRLTKHGDRPEWLPDGSGLIFMLNGRLMHIDAAGGSERELGSLVEHGDERFALAPDGKTVYFISSRRESDIWMGARP